MHIKKNKAWIAVSFAIALIAYLLFITVVGTTVDKDKSAQLFPDSRDKPLSGWTSPVFHLSQDYPTEEPTPEDLPWTKFKVDAQWKEYLNSVLAYALEGNKDDEHWDVRNNRVRKWYHAPWLHWGVFGREFIHGLTHERVSEPGELARTQTSRFQNWAVGMYNAKGGYTIRQVWKDPDNPDPTAAKFPEGTVSVKLLFTQANEKEVPYLKGAKEWDAYIYKETLVPPNTLTERVVQKMRLLQIDVAVRDSHAAPETGWVFGTFIYNGDLHGSLWERLVPVGITWGNDPKISLSDLRNGKNLSESIINTSKDVPFQHLGWGGRLNGPVDNPLSSCISCHSVAQAPVTVPLIPPTPIEQDSDEWRKWFRNLGASEPFCEGATSLGYSLQLAVGIRNFREWQRLVNNKGAENPTDPLKPCADQPNMVKPELMR